MVWLCCYFLENIWPRITLKGKVWVASWCLTLWAWTVARQAPPSMGFSRQEYWSGRPCPSPGDLPNPRIEPASPALQANSLPPEPPGRLRITLAVSKYQAVVKGEDGIVKIQQVPCVWAFKAVNVCSHVQSCEWVHASGACCHVCASSASCARAYFPAQDYIENGSTVFFSQAQGIQKQV